MAYVCIVDNDYVCGFGETPGAAQNDAIDYGISQEFDTYEATPKLADACRYSGVYYYMPVKILQDNKADISDDA